MDLRTGLDDVEERKLMTLPGLKFRTFGHPVRCQSLYLLRLSRLPLLLLLQFIIIIIQFNLIIQFNYLM
jgi:hypothetical protein